jgi:hypothetical protein
MTDAKKQAETVAKAAQKAYDVAAKKADDALAKYRPLRADANRKARELAYALANPELFEDDDLTPVQIALGRFAHTAPSRAPQAEVIVETDKLVVTSTPPVADPTFDNPITVAGTPAEERPFIPVEEAIAQHAEDLADAAPQHPTMDPGDAATGDPWDAPVEAPVEAPKPKRTRRTKAQIAADKAAAEQAELDSGKVGGGGLFEDPNAEDDAVDGDAVPQVFQDPFAQQVPVAPLAAAPAADAAFQVPEGHVHIGFDQSGNPTFAKLQPTSAPVGQAPVIQPPF